MIEFAYQWSADTYLILSFGIVGALVLVLLFAQALFGFYLAYCTLRVAHDSGRLKELPLPVRAASYTHLAVGLALDVLFNFTIATLVFLELPDVREPTFTQRCKKHLHKPGLRGRMATWVCDGWLNPFEPGHC